MKCSSTPVIVLLLAAVVVQTTGLNRADRNAGGFGWRFDMFSIEVSPQQEQQVEEQVEEGSPIVEYGRDRQTLLDLQRQKEEEEEGFEYGRDLVDRDDLDLEEQLLHLRDVDTRKYLSDLEDPPHLDLGNLSNDLGHDQGPPPYQEAARMARYVTHNSQWASLATISTRAGIEGFPFANVFSISDGVSVQESTGIPYMYLTSMEMSVKDLQKNSRASMTMSLAQGAYCDKQGYDAEDPRCAHIILTGTIVQVPTKSAEEAFAQKVLFSRHPEMNEWPKDHGWFFAKMEIANVLVLDFFGGVKTVPVEDYFKAQPV